MSDKTSPGAARITKTTRVLYTVTSDDISSQMPLHIDAVWDSPFEDLNYTADCNVEAVAPASPDASFVNGFTRDVNKLTASVSVSNAGDVIALHAHAIHD